jgi:hypothetical protein
VQLFFRPLFSAASGRGNFSGAKKLKTSALKTKNLLGITQKELHIGY